jgi:hypothetical protein
MIEIDWEKMAPPLMVYSVGLTGLLLSLRNIKTLDSVNDNQSIASFDSHQSPSYSSDSESDPESSMERLEFIRRRTSQVNAKNEFRFFKDLNVFFRLDNRYICYLVGLITVLVVVLCYFYAQISFALAFIVGFVEFFSGFWFVRVMFIKTTLSLDLSSDDRAVRWKNWNAFIKFVFSCLMFEFSGSIISVYSIVLFNEWYHGDAASSHENRNFLLFLLAFYYCGKNLLHVFNNMWEGFNMNKQILKLLSKQYNRTKMLAFYSQGYYFNVMSRIYKQGILVSELLVVLTVCGFKMAPGLQFFFSYFYAVLLAFVIVFYLVVNNGFNFRDSKESIAMITVLKLGFTYFFVITFLFLFYRHFISKGVRVKEGGTREFSATFSYAYLLMAVMFLLQKISQYVFERNEFVKLKRLDALRLEYFLNFQMILKLSTILIIAYATYLLLGFIGILFMILYLTIQKVLYRLKKFMIVFDIYIRIVLWVCQVVPIHHFTFNKLLELIDKGYIQNFYMLLFTIPLFAGINDARNLSKPSDSYSFEAHLFIAFLTVIGSMCALAVYTRLIHQKYMDTIERRSLKSLFQKNYLMLIIAHKLYFLLAISAATLLFIYFSLIYFSFSLVLSLMIGLALHAVQLIYTNKIRVKKYFNVRLAHLQDESFIMKINHELDQSPTYIKSVCELSFASIIVEAN